MSKEKKLQIREQNREATIRNFRIVRLEGEREVARTVEHYSLDTIIAVGFRVNSARAIQFRQWATGVLRDYAIFEKYRMVQDRLFESDFDRHIKQALEGGKEQA